INQVSFQVAKFESFVFKEVSFNVYMLLGWYCVIFSFFIWVQHRSFSGMKTLFFSVLALQTIYIYNAVKVKNSDEFIVFNKNRTTLLSERRSNEISVFTNDSVTEKEYLIRSYKIGSFSKKIQIDSLQHLYFSNGKKILLIDDVITYDEGLSPDVVLLVGSPKLNLDRFLKKHKPEIIVADASNYKSYIQLWKQTCEERKIRFRSTYEVGFFKIGN